MKSMMRAVPSLRWSPFLHSSLIREDNAIQLYRFVCCRAGRERAGFSSFAFFDVDVANLNHRFDLNRDTTI